jgi:NTP pyrophosphatase (non-canonical NTP hydrolase)
MNYKQFKKDAMRTCKVFGYQDRDLSHMVLGMTSEINELLTALETSDNTNILEEVVDIMWYVAGYETFRKLNVLEQINTKEDVTPQFPIVISISKLVDLVKKFNVYGRKIDEKEEEFLLSDIYKACIAITNSLELDIEQGFDKVINKLKHRFPEKFTEDLANNRDLETERKILEGK